jgi:hypothetical protein
MSKQITYYIKYCKGNNSAGIILGSPTLGCDHRITRKKMYGLVRTIDSFELDIRDLEQLRDEIDALLGDCKETKEIK